VITVPALPLDGDEADRGHAAEVPARGLRRDAGDAGKFGRRQRAPVHQRVQHAGAPGVSGKRGDLGEHCVAGHGVLRVRGPHHKALVKPMLRPFP
jgi:hypothetical protein